MHKYRVEFILNTQDASQEVLKESLIEFGEALEIVPVPQNDTERGKSFKIQIYSWDPTIIFDTCAQFGRLKFVKVHEGKE